ncbi:hypothetical protein [Streptomyces iconiensis]|uniref:hypothetical protein n=1 Tax=Streptomyces iconiensis TaxID=1384038 RepID=UPI003D2F544F
MVLDEPSAGLDAAAEHEIHTSLREHRGARTSLLISHRLGNLRDADTIAVLTDGKVVEQGDHAALMASGGRYAQLLALQATGYRQEPDERTSPGERTPPGERTSPSERMPPSEPTTVGAADQ